ncbi:MAG: nuclear transport factor 2 family protein [Mycobacteriaceae bacterium]
MSTSEILTVLAWHDALNTGEIDTLLALSSDDIEIGGQNSASQGQAALQHWATPSEITMTPGAVYYHDGVVVTEETVPGQPEIGAAAFRVVHDKVTSIFMHPNVDTALAATGLEDADRVAQY